MLHVCAARFDVTGNLKKLFEFRGELNKAIVKLKTFFRTKYYIFINLTKHDPRFF